MDILLIPKYIELLNIISVHLFICLKLLGVLLEIWISIQGL